MNPDIMYNDHRALAAVMHEAREILLTEKAIENSGGYLSGETILRLNQTAPPSSGGGGSFHKLAEETEGAFLEWLPNFFD